MKSFIGLLTALVITSQAAVAEGEPRASATPPPVTIDRPLSESVNEPADTLQPVLDRDSTRVSTELDALLEMRLGQEARVAAPPRGQVAGIN
ncbi:MAG: hypothetical protein KDI01_05630 [Halioglobus sp.]|nr:hypothetical protein [Halioglobus sp.]